MCKSLVRFWDLKTALREAVTSSVSNMAELKLYAGSKRLLPLLSDAGSRGKEIFLKPVFISEKFAMVNLQKLTFFISSYFQRKFYPCIKLNIKSRRSRTRRGCWLGNTSKGRIHVMPWVIVHAYKYKYST